MDGEDRKNDDLFNGFNGCNDSNDVAGFDDRESEETALERSETKETARPGMMADADEAAGMGEENLNRFFAGQGMDILDLQEEKEEIQTKTPPLITDGMEGAEMVPSPPPSPQNVEAEWHFSSETPLTGEDWPATQRAKQRGGWKKKILAVAGGLVAVVLVAFSSIGVYTLFFEEPRNTTDHAGGKTSTVQQISSDEGLTVAEIAAKVTPSVVGITVESAQGVGTGSGIIMSEDGYIITNAHVVSGMTNVQVVLMDGTTYPAKVVGADTQTDLALLKINGKGLTAAEFGDSDQVVIGAGVVAIGNPLGLDFAGSVSDGIVSGLDRELEIEGQVMHYIQTNASINSGNSGGPLVNHQGQVIGINSAKINSTVAEGMGFAIPINAALPIIEELKTNGYVAGRPQIGIAGQDIDEQSAGFYQVPAGVLVQQITPGSGAEAAGIQRGDIITAIEGGEIASVAQLNAVKNDHAPGDTVRLTIYRNGQSFDVKVVLTEQNMQ